MKKWSYAAAMMLALAGGSIFTGCIDNDEPYGLREVRLATADLLKSKAAALEAEKAAKEAELEISKLRVEVEKMHAEAELERIKSEERINQITAEAAAAKDNAEAQRILAQADSIRTAAQAMYESVQADIKNKRDIVDKKLEFADQRLTELKYDFAQAQLKDADCRKSKLYCLLEGAYQDYIWTLEQYNGKLNEIALAEAELDKAKVDLKWVWKSGVNDKGEPINPAQGGYWVSPKYDTEEAFNNLIANYNKQKEGLTENIKVLEEANQKLEALQDSELFTLLEEYTKAKDALQLNIAELKVEKDAIRINNPDVFDAADAAYKVIADSMNNRTHPIPAYTFKPTADLAALGMTKDKVVVAENQTYKLQYATDEDGITTSEIVASESYTNAENRYKGQIARVKNFLMDDFDKAWTEASKNELKNELTAANADYAVAEAAWKQAKGVYNMGQKPVVTNALPGEKAYEDAMAVYNTGLANIETLVTENATAKKDWETATANYQSELTKYNNSTSTKNKVDAAWLQAQTDYNNALAKAETDYTASTTAAVNTYNATKLALDAKVNELNVKVYDAQQVVNQYNTEIAADPDNKTLQDGLKAAKDELAAAEKARDAFVGTPASGDAAAVKGTYDTELEKAQAAQTTAYQNARIQRVKDIQAATDAYAEAFTAYCSSPSYETAEKDPEYAPVLAAETVRAAAESAYLAKNAELVTAEGNILKLWTAMANAFNNQATALGIIGMVASYPDWDSVDDYVNNGGAKPAAPMIPMMMQGKDVAKYVSGYDAGMLIPANVDNNVYINAKMYVIQMSAAAYGDLSRTDDGKYADQAVLVDAVTPEMINDYIAKNYFPKSKEEVSIAECYRYYEDFGAYGQTLYLQSRLDVADAMLANSDLAENNIAAMQANLAVMAQSLKNAEAGFAKVQQAYKDAAQAVDDLYTEVNEKIYLAEQLVKPYEQIVRSLQSAVNIYYANETEKTLTNNTNAQDAVKTAIDSNNKWISMNQAWLENIEKYLARAEYQQNQLQAGIANAEADSTQQIALDKLNAEADVLKQNVEFYLTRVQDLTKAYEDALGKTAE